MNTIKPSRGTEFLGIEQPPALQGFGSAESAGRVPNIPHFETSPDCILTLRLQSPDESMLTMTLPSNRPAADAHLAASSAVAAAGGGQAPNFG